MASSVFNLGELIGAFGSTKQRPVFTSPEIADRYRYDLLGEYDKNRTAQQGDLAKYADLISAGNPQAKQFSDEDTASITKLLGDYGSYDPTATYERVRSGNLASLNDQFANLVNYGSAADKARMASLGLGGRASSGSYGKVLDSVRAARNLSPVLNTIYGNLGSDTSRLTQDRYQNLMSQLGLMNQRAGLYDQRVAGRALIPSLARNAALQTDVGNLSGIGQGFNQNVAGWEAQPNGVARWGNAVGAIDKGLNSALDTYMSMYGGGLMGGGGGGGGAGMGGMMGMMGGGQGGGYAGNQEVMSLLSRYLQQGQQRPNYGYQPITYGYGGYNALGPGLYDASNIP